MKRPVLWLLGLLLASSCIDEPCDPNQHSAHGVCVPVFGFYDAHPVDARDGDAGPELSVPFGATCHDHGECGGETNLCAVIPGSSSGICTHTGCLEDPAVCPPTMGCLDLTSYGAPGVSICWGVGP